MSVAELFAVASALSPEKGSVKTMNKRELRKLLKKQIIALQDTTPGNKKVTISADKEKLQEIKSEVEGLKNSVKVERAGEDKVVVKYKKPRNELSNTTIILLAVAAVLVLAILFSIPYLGGLLAFILGLAVVAAAVALLLGVIEIHQN
jgi:allophanate hydrolase subunit 1